MAIGEVAVGDAERGAQGERVVPGNAAAAPGQGEVLRSRRGRLPEGEVAPERLVGDAQRDRDPLAFFGGDAADEAARVGVRPGQRGGGEQPGRGGDAERVLIDREILQLVRKRDRLAALHL